MEWCGYWQPGRGLSLSELMGTMSFLGSKYLYLLTPSGNWLLRQDVGCFLLLSHIGQGNRRKKRFKTSLNPVCPGKTAIMFIFFECLEAAASFQKVPEDPQPYKLITKTMPYNKNVRQWVLGFLLCLLKIEVSKKIFPIKYRNALFCLTSSLRGWEHWPVNVYCPQIPPLGS